MFCKNCEKEIDENANFCPNCGEQINHSKKKTNVFAYLSFWGLFFPILGLIFGGIGIMKAEELEDDGKYAAILGIVLSFIAIIIEMLFFKKYGNFQFVFMILINCLLRLL